MSVPADVHFYIWYRVSGDHAEAQRVIVALQDDVAARTDIRGRILVRRDDRTTWMEIYEGVASPEVFEHELAAAVAHHRAASIAHGGARHLEAFVGPH